MKTFFPLLVGFFCFVLGITHPAFSGCVDGNRGNYKEIQKCLNARFKKVGENVGDRAGKSAGQVIAARIDNPQYENGDFAIRDSFNSRKLERLIDKEAKHLAYNKVKPSDYEWEKEDAKKYGCEEGKNYGGIANVPAKCLYDKSFSRKEFSFRLICNFSNREDLSQYTEQTSLWSGKGHNDGDILQNYPDLDSNNSTRGQLGNFVEFKKLCNKRGGVFALKALDTDFEPSSHSRDRLYEIFNDAPPPSKNSVKNFVESFEQQLSREYRQIGLK